MRRIFVSLIPLLLACAPANAGALRLCVDNESHYPLLTPDGGGAAGVLARLAAADSDLELTWHAAPAARCREELRAGVVDGYPLIGFYPAMRLVLSYPMNGDVADASRAVLSARAVVVRRKGSDVAWDGQRFSGLNGSVLLQFGYDYLKSTLNELGVRIDDHAKSVEANLQKLAIGRGDAAVVLEVDALPLLARPEYGSKLEVLPVPLSAEVYYLTVTHTYYRDHKADVERLWAAIGRLRNSPRYKLAMRAYLTRGSLP